MELLIILGIGASISFLLYLVFSKLEDYSYDEPVWKEPTPKKRELVEVMKDSEKEELLKYLKDGQ